jgi:hypothetical protein
MPCKMLSWFFRTEVNKINEVAVALICNDFVWFLIGKSGSLGEDRLDVIYTGLYFNIYYLFCHLCRACNSADSLAFGYNDLLADSQFQARKSPEQNVLNILPGI